MSAHTPGPWTTDEQDHDGQYQNIKIKSGWHHTVCTVWISDAPVRDFNAEQTANAILIAAAPKLHEELENCVDLLIRCFPDAAVDSCIGQAIAKGNAAIAKATGGAA